MKNKVYEVRLAHADEKSGEESFNIESKTVLAKDVFDAVDKTGDWFLEEEKSGKRKKYNVFIESIELLQTIDVE